MRKLYVTGDLHASQDIDKLMPYKWPEGQKLNKDDCVIVAGDFGLVFYPKGAYDSLLNWLDTQPWTTLFIDGNHENFDDLLSYPEIERFNGPVGRIRSSVYHLKRRGHVYDIAGHKVWCFGGAESVDKENRIEGKSWWPEEEPTKEQMEYGLSEIEKYSNKIDFIITHDCPCRVLYSFWDWFCINNDADKIYATKVGQYLDDVTDLVTAKCWYFGHYHTDMMCESQNKQGIQQYRALFNDIIRME